MKRRVQISDPFFVVAEAVRQKVQQHGGLRPAGRALGIDAAYLKRLRDGEKRDPSDDVLKALGVRREVSYHWMPKRSPPNSGAQQ